MGSSVCGAPEKAKSKGPVTDSNEGDLWHRQFELSKASRSLLSAATAGDFFMVEKQLGMLGKPNSCNAGGLTPLHAATELGRGDIIKLLLKHRADIDAPPGPDFAGPPIALASHHGHLGCVKILLQANAPPEALSNPYDSTCVHRAAAEGHAGCLRELLSAHHFTAKVAELGGLENTILEPHVLIANFQDANERLPLHRAASPGHCDCVQILIHEGYSLLDVKDFHGDSPLHMAVLTYNEEFASEISEFILTANGNVNITDEQQRTPLHLVANAGRIQVTATLLWFKADVGACELLRGRTPLHVAAKTGAVEVCCQLLEAKGDVKAVSRDGSGTALMCAAPACMEVLALAMQRAERGTYYWRRDLLTA